MKKIFLFTILISFMPVLAANAQTVTTVTAVKTGDGPSQPADTSKKEITIHDESGDQIVHIAKNRETGDALSINISGFEIELGGRKSPETYESKTSQGVYVIQSAPDVPATERSGRSVSAVINFNPWHKRRFKGCQGVLEWGFNGFASPDYSLYQVSDEGFLDLNMGKSIYFGWNIIRASTPLDRAGRFGLTTGLGLVWRDFVFSENITLVRQNRMIHPEPIAFNAKKSKLSTWSLQVPILLEARFGRKMFLSGGVYGDITLKTHTKYKKPKHKDKSSHYVNMFQAGVTARFGFRSVYIFGNYGFTNFFEKGKGPETSPYTIGFNFLI